jgi:hypothetical protein
MNDDEGISSDPVTQDFPPPPLIGAEHEATAVRTGDAGRLPPPPVEDQGPAPSPRRFRILKVVGVLMIVLGALLLLAAPGEFGRTPQDGPVIFVLVLVVGTLAGGVHLVRHGWWTGHDVRNVIAVLPPFILIALVVLGIVAGGGEPRAVDDLSRVFSAAKDYRLSTGPVWADYADPQISARRWVRTVDETMPSLEASLAALDAEVARIQDAEVRADCEAVADLLDDELSALVDIRSAVDQLDVRAEQVAWRRLLEVQHEGAELIRRLVSESGGQPS